jgi:ribulose-bisphosphate carboxylase large chain
MTRGRFRVTYRIFASDLAAARAVAEGIALEQTVEVPRDAVPPGYIADEIVGRIEDAGAEGGTKAGAGGRFRVTISYSPDSCGAELPQLLNVIFGNSSIQQGIKVIGFDPGPLTAHFPGARFGISGIRRLAGAPRGALIAPVLKPQGSTARVLADIARTCALNGAHIVKEDHGLTDQAMAPFRARVERIASAVGEANARTGRRTLYFANLAGQSGDLMANARFARDAGADGFLVMPGLFGFDLIRRLATAPDLDMPVMSHPSFLGPHVLTETTGFSHGMMFGTLQRLAGADISVFPNVGGRFGFSAEACREIAGACRDAAGIGAPILPSPGGGMSLDRAADMLAMYGEDAVFLLGGSLLRQGDGMGAAIAALMARVDRHAQAAEADRPARA